MDDYASTPFLPVPFEEAIRSGHFDKNILIIAGFTSEEGLIYTAPFEKSKRRWNLFFDEWDKWSPLLLFNRESDLISNLEVDVRWTDCFKVFHENGSILHIIISLSGLRFHVAVVSLLQLYDLIRIHVTIAKNLFRLPRKFLKSFSRNQGRPNHRKMYLSLTTKTFKIWRTFFQRQCKTSPGTFHCILALF